jgi:predicted permease
MLDAILEDSRAAIRVLRASPAFTAVAILSLALGIGANSAIFTLIDVVMLKSLPVQHPEELVQVTTGDGLAFNNPIWEQVRDRQDVFSGVFAYGMWAFNLAPGGEVRNVNGHFVSGHYFDTLGVRAALGRTLVPADDKPGCPGAAVLRYGFWQREYGGRGDIVGNTISIDRHPIVVVGVAEPGFAGVEVGTTADVMVPICSERIIHRAASRIDWDFLPGFFKIVGRLEPGVTASQAKARLKTLAPEIYKATLPRKIRPEDRDRFLAGTFETLPAVTGLSYLRGQYRQALMVLMGIVVVVLLITCANIANLLLARGAARQHEIAIRMALGCGAGRLIRQWLAESLLLSGVGAAFGVLLAQFGTRVLIRYLGASIDLTPDIRVLTFTAGVAIVTGLLCGIAPAWRGTRIQPQAAMKKNSRGVVEGSKVGLGKVLVMAQIALSMLLVAGAGLMLATFWKLTSLDAGFNREGVLLAGIGIPEGKGAAVYPEVLKKLREIPGVRSASVSGVFPICHCQWKGELSLDGYVGTSREDITVNLNRVSGRYFETLGGVVLAGRDFDEHDSASSLRVAIVNQALAQKYFAGKNPLGRYLRVRRGDEIGDPVEVVGVVKDEKYGSLRDGFVPTVYMAWGQDDTFAPLTKFELRPWSGAPVTLINAAKSAIAEVDPRISIEFTTLADQVDDSISRERLLAVMSSFFGALALLLALIGLYSVMSYNVARRRNEIGIRMALGAERWLVHKMVLGEVSSMVGIGLTVGLGATLTATRLLQSFLYDLAPNDPWTLTSAAAVLVATALLAGYIPARRASRLDPMDALREE